MTSFINIYIHNKNFEVNFQMGQVTLAKLLECLRWKTLKASKSRTLILNAGNALEYYNHLGIRNIYKTLMIGCSNGFREGTGQTARTEDHRCRNNPRVTKDSARLVQKYIAAYIQDI